MRRFGLLLAVAFLLSIGADAKAGVISGSLWINQSETPGGDIDNAIIANTPITTPDATFNPVAINFNSNVTSYTIGPFLNNPTFNTTSAAFLTAGGGTANLDDTFFLFTGTTFLKAGPNTFVTPHDDGFELSIPGAGFDLQDGGPTAAVNTPYTVNAPSDGTYSFTLSYAEGFGPPAVLGFTVNGTPVSSTPEPGTLTLLGIGIVGMAGYGWRRRNKKALPC